MAQKRMFDSSIIDTDRFMDLPMSSKAIYFLLGMEADDEGFCSYKKVLRIHGGSEDDVKLLVLKGFLISFPSGVIVITDWNNNNYLDKNRIKETQYQKEKQMLSITPQKKYFLRDGSDNVFNKCLTSIEENSIEESRTEENNIEEKDKIFSITIEEVIKLRNNIETFPKTRKITEQLKKSRKQVQNNYTLEEFEIGVNNYYNDTINRIKTNDPKGYDKHRFTFYEYIKQDNGLQKWINK